MGGLEGEGGLRLMSVKHPPPPLSFSLYTFIDGLHLPTKKKRKKGKDNQSSRRVLFHSQSELSLLVILFSAC